MKVGQIQDTELVALVEQNLGPVWAQTQLFNMSDALVDLAALFDLAVLDRPEHHAIIASSGNQLTGRSEGQ